MREHEPINVRLPALGPLAVVFTDNCRTVPQNVRHLFERGALFE